MIYYTVTDSPVKVDLKRFLEAFSIDDAYDINRSEFVRRLSDLPALGSFYVRGEDNRLDWISYQLYKTTSYWWILLLYNGLVDPLEVVSGMSIRYPSITDIDSLVIAMQKGSSEVKVVSKPNSLRAPRDFVFLNGNLKWRLLNYSETSIQVERFQDRKWSVLATLPSGTQEYSLDQVVGSTLRYRLRLRDEESFVLTSELEVSL